MRSMEFVSYEFAIVEIFQRLLHGSEFLCTVHKNFNRKLIDELERILHGETEEDHDETQNSPLSGRDSNRKPE
jgi:hypothetical protein